MMLIARIMIVGVLCLWLTIVEAEAAIAETEALLGGSALLAWMAGLVLGGAGIIGGAILLGRFVVNREVAVTLAIILVAGSTLCYGGACQVWLWPWYSAVSLAAPYLAMGIAALWAGGAAAERQTKLDPLDVR